MSTQNLLVELFVEELPPKVLKKLGEAFATVLADQLRAQGLAALGDWLRALSGGTGLLLVLDDVHWADAPSLRWLRHDRLLLKLAAMLFVGVGLFNALATWLDAHGTWMCTSSSNHQSRVSRTSASSAKAMNRANSLIRIMAQPSTTAASVLPFHDAGSSPRT